MLNRINGVYFPQNVQFLCSVERKMKLSVLKIELGKTATARMISFCVLGLKSVKGKGKYEYIFLGRMSISVIYVCVCLKMFTLKKKKYK